MELQMAFGQTKRNEFTGADFHNGAMDFMAGAGGKFPPGTTFPNHVLMGFDSDYTTVSGFQALKITRLEPGLPAERAGLLVGDVVTRIANKRFRTVEVYLDATAKAAERASYEVELVRNGKTMKLTLEKALRPASTEQVIAAFTAPPAAAAPAQSSVADELAKLAKLKADGVLTSEEFDSQKKKILGQ